MKGALVALGLGLAPLFAAAQGEARAERWRRGPVLISGGARPLLDRLPATVPPEGSHLVLALGTGAGEAQRIELEPGSRAADDLAWSEPLAAARVIEFEAGPPDDWVDTLFPRRRSSSLMRELWQRHRSGAAVCGVGAGALLLGSATWIAPEERREIERNPRALDQTEAVWTLGLFPWGVIETEAHAARGLSPLCRLLFDQHLDLAWILDEQALLRAEAERPFVAIEGGAPLILDLGRANLGPDRWLDARLSLAAAELFWLPKTRELVGEREGRAASATGGAPIEVEQALAAAAWREGLRRLLEPGGPRRCELVGPDARVVLSIDGDTRLWDAAASRVHLELLFAR